jgi:hypothetical protein
MKTTLPEPLSLPWKLKPVSWAQSGSETLAAGRVHGAVPHSKTHLFSFFLVADILALESMRRHVIRSRRLIVQLLRLDSDRAGRVARLSCRVSDRGHWLLPSRAGHAIHVRTVLLAPCILLTFLVRRCASARSFCLSVLNGD